MLSVGEFAENGNVDLDLLDQDVALVRLEKVKHPLNDIVCILVLHHGEKRLDAVGTDSHYFLNNNGAILTIGIQDALLDDIGGELVL